MLYDISPLIDERLAVWPGDTSCSREMLCDLDRGDNITLSTLRATVHLGSHADAPSHYGKGAGSIDQRPLDLYLGTAQVIRVEVPRGTLLQPTHLPGKLEAERVLFATGTFPDPTDFNQDFAALSPELIHLLARNGAKLIGIDTPSVDPFSSKELPAHHAILEHNLAILEGLVLTGVPAGLYELIALPLKLRGFDASPVRAVLRALAAESP